MIITDTSFNKAQWVLPDADLNDISQAAQICNLPDALIRILYNRNVTNDGIQDFINPTLRDHFPDPFTLASMKDTALYLANAIQNDKNIAILGDFDVDGATSSAVLYRFLKHHGIDAPIYIPDRLTEGYGPNIDALQSLKNNGAHIVVILDCGTTALDIVNAGIKMGLDIVILDHHEPDTTLPDTPYIINPKRHDDTSNLDSLAAVGVTFLTCIAIKTQLRDLKFYENSTYQEPDLRLYMDLVALGTVCDMVPLIAANRLFVRYGFKHIHNPGIQTLMDVGGVEGPLNTYHAGFVLGPRINAGSRVHKSDLGARLLSSDDAEESRNIAFTLNDCNDKRKTLQAQMEQEAIQHIESMTDFDTLPILMVDSDGWHTGLSGLVAGRLKEKYNKPVCVTTYVENEAGITEARGSGRSMPGIHIAQGFMDAKEANIIEKGGGHAMAGGFTLKPEQYDAFKSFMITHIKNQTDTDTITVTQDIDAVLTIRGATSTLVKNIEHFIGPFGQGNTEPVFAFENVRLWQVDTVGTNHIRLLMSDWEGGPRMKAMLFRGLNTPLGDALLAHKTKAFHIAGTLKINTWGGRESVEMHIKDATFATQTDNIQYAS